MNITMTTDTPASHAIADTTPPALDHVSMWTDGGCRPNPGFGSWAVLMQASNGREKELSGTEPFTTNNRMELTAAIRGLDALSRPFAVSLFTDSEYVFLGMTGRVEGWSRAGWRTAKGRSVENVELWERLIAAAVRHRMDWRWTRAHAHDPMNLRVDRLVSAARERGAFG